MDTLVTEDRPRSTNRVPTMAMTPMISGRTAAMRPRKASTSSSRVSSSAIDSALTRSCLIWLLASTLTIAAPPTTTRRGGRPMVIDCVATRWAVAVWVAPLPVA